MTDERQDRLIDDYLQGRSDEAAIREIDRLAREDHDFRETLMAVAVVEAALRDRSPASVGPGRGRARLAGLAAATGAAAAVAGWLWVAAVPGRSDACQVVDTRGRVLLLAETKQEQATSVSSGDVIASGRRIWTCPWGAVALRLADGSRIQFDRGSEARLQCTPRPHIDLAQGIVFVTRNADEAGSTTITSQHASVTIDSGLAAVITDEERTVIEVAAGEAWLSDHPDGARTKISAGQVAVVKQNQAGGISVHQGRLSWELPPVPEE